MEYTIHTSINCIDSFETPEGEWNCCPNCGLLPKVWEFDNGRSTACGCWNSMYDHFSIEAECIMSVYKHNNNAIDYDSDGLRKNWNHWCETGEILFEKLYNRW